MKIAGLSDRYLVAGKELTQKKPNSVKSRNKKLWKCKMACIPWRYMEKT
ncbi:hypothetical protein [Butyrivibrio fibrisolvens]|jgi:hypothetical protein|nr:hypothetical protein [Butyrivibrio fibrisolvens]